MEGKRRRNQHGVASRTVKKILVLCKKCKRRQCVDRINSLDILYSIAEYIE